MWLLLHRWVKFPINVEMASILESGGLLVETFNSYYKCIKSLRRQTQDNMMVNFTHIVTKIFRNDDDSSWPSPWGENYTNTTDSSVLGKDNTKIEPCGPNIDNLQIYISNEMSTARGPPMLPPRQAHTHRAIETTSLLPWSLSQWMAPFSGQGQRSGHQKVTMRSVLQHLL